MSHRTTAIVMARRHLRSPPSRHTNSATSTIRSHQSTEELSAVIEEPLSISSGSDSPNRRRRRALVFIHNHLPSPELASPPPLPQSPFPSYHHRHVQQQYQHQQHRCYASASNIFWKDLNDAVQDGDAIQAEEMVRALLNEGSSSSSSDNGKQQRRDPIDTKLFSMVLQAWKNHQQTNRLRTSSTNSGEHTSGSTRSVNTGLRATTLVKQMANLAKSGVLTEPPSLEDYHAVLECWIQQTSSPPWSTKNDEEAPTNTSQHIQDLLLLIPEPTTESMELALEVLANEGNHNEILEIIWKMREQALGRRKSSKKATELQPTLHMYNSLIKAYTIEGTPELALLLLEKMQEQSGKDSDTSRLPLPSPNSETYNLLISHYCAKPHPERIKQAEILLDQMRDQKVQRTASSYLPLITGLSKMAEAKRAENLLERMVRDYHGQFDVELKPTLAPFRSVLWGYSKSYHPDAAQDAELLLNNMIELHQTNVLEERPSTWSFNLVLKCWARSKDPTAPRRAKQLYDRMSSQSIAPDSTSMNTVLNTWAKKANPMNTEKLFWDFYNAYIQDPLQHPQPNIISFGTLLNALASKASRYPEAPDRAETLFRKLFELHQAGWDDCRPDSAAFSSLMQCWGKSKQPGAAEKAESILRKMQELAEEGADSEMAPDTICWNSAIQAWAIAGDGERAEALFREMLTTYIRNKDDRHKPNIITFTAVLSAWAKTRFNRQAAKRAESLLAQMEKLHVSGALDVKPNYVSYSIVLDALAYAKKKSATERAEALLEQMKESTDRDLQPNVVSYNAVIKAWSFVQDPRTVSKVISLLDELIEKSQKNHRMAPNANTFGSILKTIADSRHDDKASRADAIVALMENFNIVLNDWGKNQLKRCYASASREVPQSEKIAMPDLPPLDYSS
ncbi:MAG: hypothetical protein SGBAC_008915 [Bacillariaceae sp.]